MRRLAGGGQSRPQTPEIPRAAGPGQKRLQGSGLPGGIGAGIEGQLQQLRKVLLKSPS